MVYILKEECGWVHMMEIFLSGNWVCAWDGPWRFPGKFLCWIRSGRCGWVPGWKFPDGPQIGNIDGLVVENGMERTLGHELGVFSGI